MQLTLPTTLGQPSVTPGPAPMRVPAAPSRDAVAMSQLDRIAAQNLRAPAHGLGGTATLLALLGGLVVLGSASMWRGSPGDEPREVQKVALTENRSTPATAAPALTAFPTVAIEPAVPAVTSLPEAASMAAPESATAVLAAADPAADDAARKARARQQADARRKATQLAQERALAEETQRLQLAQQQQLETERAQQQLLAEQARQRVAAEQARLQSVQLALDTRRSVSETCSAAGSLISRQFCRSRECSKAEHVGDSVCLSLREDEQARQRASLER